MGFCLRLAVYGKDGRRDRRGAAPLVHRGAVPVGGRAVRGAQRPSYIAGLSLLGGEPFEPQNQRALLPLLRRVRREFPQKTVWCYSGYLYDADLQPGGRAHCEATDEMLSYIDVLVDGEFVEELKDLKLRFRGSSNQRIIDLPATRAAGKIVLWQPSK